MNAAAAAAVSTYVELMQATPTTLHGTLHVL